MTTVVGNSDLFKMPDGDIIRRHVQVLRKRLGISTTKAVSEFELDASHPDFKDTAERAKLLARGVIQPNRAVKRMPVSASQATQG